MRRLMCELGNKISSIFLVLAFFIIGSMGVMLASVMPADLEIYGTINRGSNIIFVTNKLESAIIFKTDYEKRSEAGGQKEEFPEGVNLIVGAESSKYRYFPKDESYQYYIGKPRREIEITYKSKEYRIKFPGENTVIDIVLAENEVIYVGFDWQNPGWDVVFFKKSKQTILEFFKKRVFN